MKSDLMIDIHRSKSYTDRMLALDQQVSDCIRQSVVDSCHPLKIMIFGSYATGNATSESDVDIIAVVGNDQQVGSDATVKVRLAIRKALKALGKNMAFDFILSKQAVFEEAKNQNGTIQYVANQQGVVIYG
jgi:predicted nucleotidyltransferase